MSKLRCKPIGDELGPGWDVYNSKGFWLGIIERSNRRRRYTFDGGEELTPGELRAIADFIEAHTGNGRKT